MTSNNLHEWREPSQPPSGCIDDLPARRLRDLLRMRGQLLLRGGSLTYPLRIHPKWYDRAVSDLATFGLATYFAYESDGGWFVIVRDACPRHRPVNADSLDRTLCRRRPHRPTSLDDLPDRRLREALHLLRLIRVECVGDFSYNLTSHPRQWHGAMLDLAQLGLITIDAYSDQPGQWRIRVTPTSEASKGKGGGL